MKLDNINVDKIKWVYEKYVLTGKWEIREKGRVYSYISGKYLTYIDKGYYCASVKIPGTRRTARVKIHHLVYYSHYGFLDEELTVDHINGDKLDNSPENLELVSGSENSKRAIKTGLYDHAERVETAAKATRKLTEDEVRYIRTCGKDREGT